MKRALLIFLIAICYSHTYAQTLLSWNLDSTGFITENFKFNKESVDYKIDITVDKSLDHLYFNFRSGLVTGNLEVKFMDPNNKVEGTLMLEGAKFSNDSRKQVITANGNVIKDIENPLSGNWTLIIKSNDAIGDLTVSINNESYE